MQNKSDQKTSEGNAPREKHPSLAWSSYMNKARLIATDAQLSNDVGVIARLLLAEVQRDELLAALYECYTGPLAHGYTQPERFARERFDKN